MLIAADWQVLNFLDLLKSEATPYFFHPHTKEKYSGLAFINVLQHKC